MISCGESSHHQESGWRQAPPAGALAGGRPRAATKGLRVTLMAPPPYDEPVRSRRECRQVIRVFLGSLGIGFAIMGIATWAVDSGRFSDSNFQAKAPAPSIATTGARGHSAEASATDDSPSVRIEAVEDRNLDDNVPAVLASASSSNDAASAAASKPAERVSDAASVQPVRSSTAQTTGIPVPGHPSRTAIYDIAAHTVYLPNGQTLEAHSGLGTKRDNPRYVKVKNQGPTPPNIYELALREKLFHKVQAIRLIPVGDGKMFGRDGILAHSYMLGANGQSNGCVSFKDYPAFLRAYLKGEIDRLVVVSRISNATWHTASAVLGPQLLDTN